MRDMLRIFFCGTSIANRDSCLPESIFTTLGGGIDRRRPPYHHRSEETSRDQKEDRCALSVSHGDVLDLRRSSGEQAAHRHPYRPSILSAHLQRE